MTIVRSCCPSPQEGTRPQNFPEPNQVDSGSSTGSIPSSDCNFKSSISESNTSSVRSKTSSRVRTGTKSKKGAQKKETVKSPKKKVVEEDEGTKKVRKPRLKPSRKVESNVKEVVSNSRPPRACKVSPKNAESNSVLTSNNNQDQFPKARNKKRKVKTVDGAPRKSPRLAFQQKRKQKDVSVPVPRPRYVEDPDLLDLDFNNEAARVKFMHCLGMDHCPQRALDEPIRKNSCGIAVVISASKMPSTTTPSSVFYGRDSDHDEKDVESITVVPPVRPKVTTITTTTIQVEINCEIEADKPEPERCKDGDLLSNDYNLSGAKEENKWVPWFVTPRCKAEAEECPKATQQEIEGAIERILSLGNIELTVKY